jgi:hypothetical protein
MGSRRLHGWRKLAGAFRGAPNDPQFYGDVEIDAGTPLEHLHQVRSRTGVRITVTHAYAPMASYYRVPCWCSSVRSPTSPVAVAGQAVVRPILMLTATFDHRYADGAQAARFAAAVKDAPPIPSSSGCPPYDRSPRPTDARHVGVRRGYRGRDVPRHSPGSD